MRPTPSQTIGPFFRFGFDWLPSSSAGVQVHGRVLDGAGEPVPDAVVETWQPGRFGRALTDDNGGFALAVAAPGPVSVSVFARGLVQRVVTRLYLPGDEEDAVLAAVDPARRSTLRAVADRGGARFDIRLQGPEETVFFAW